ncbi:MAG TPA: hypothetical protein VM221_00195 [Armatimonadota bacterium]|nr:hypothetical protein [Armatimonadota bacterium]
MRRLIEDGLREGEFQGLEPELTACLLFGMIHVFFMQRLATGRRFPSEVVVAHTMALLRHRALLGSAADHRSGHDAKGRR